MLDQATPQGLLTASLDAPQASPTLAMTPSAPVTLGAWGLAHLTGECVRQGHPHLVGREFESLRLVHILDQVSRERSPAILTVSAPAGMGKTRLIAEALRLAPPRLDGRVHVATAQPGDSSRALIARLLRTRFGLRSQDEPAQQRASLLAQVAEILRDERVADVCVFLGRLLDLEMGETPLSRALSHDPFPTELATESILCELFAADARHAPLCFVVEDLQHADADSLALLMAILDQLSGPVLAICSARPQFFARHDYFTEFGGTLHEHLDLKPLDVADVQQLLVEGLGEGALGCQGLTEHARCSALGNPGILLEVTAEIRATGAFEPGSTAVPPSFHPERLRDRMSEAPTFAVMETRLQALPHRARLMLEAAALLGGPCWSGLLIRLSRALDQHPRRTSPPHEALEYLVNAGHLLPVPDSQIGEQVEYILRRPEERHLLLDAIGSRRRREYQRVAAEWLEQQGDVEQSSELQALLARLLVGAGASHRGALVYGNAAETARSEGCRSKTIAYLREALDHLDPTDVRRRLEFLHDLGAALVEQGDHVGARRAFEDMLELADSLGLPNKQGAALNRLGRLCRECGDLSRARVFFQRACAAFDSAGDTRGLFATQDDLGKVMWLEGDWLGALPFLRSSLEGRKTIGDRRSLAVSLSNLALAWEQKGNLDSAREAIRMASRFFDAEHDDHGRCDTLLVLGQFATHRHDLSLAAAYFEQAANIAVAASDKTRLARCLLQLGETRLREDLLDVAASLLERAREVAESVEAWLDLAEAHRALAKVALKRERLRQARTHVRISLHLARRTHSRSQLSATLRTLAEVAAAGAWSSSTEGRAVRFFMLSIDLAKQTNNDLALAKGYRSFARYATRFPLPEIQRQSAILRDMSHELFGLHEVQS